MFVQQKLDEDKYLVATMNGALGLYRIHEVSRDILNRDLSFLLVLDREPGRFSEQFRLAPLGRKRNNQLQMIRQKAKEKIKQLIEEDYYKRFECW